MSLLITEVTIADPRTAHNGQQADVLINNGIIEEITEAGRLSHSGYQAIQAGGLFLSPGWVDLFAHYCDPGEEHKETITTGLNAAAAGGFTDVLSLPNTNPPADNKGAIQYAKQQAAGHQARLHPLGAITKGIEGKVLAEMLDMHAHGAIAFTDGWKPVQNAGLMQKALEYVKAFKGLLIQLPVEQSLSSGTLMHEGLTSTRLGLPGVPALAETLIINRDIELLRYTGSRLHITGVSTAAGLELIRTAKEEGLDITCSVTPYHLLFTEDDMMGYDSMYKVTPPLRSEADRQALIAGLADGTIDCIASHHRPQDWDAKQKELEYAAAGMAVQESVWGMLLKAAGEIMDIDRLIDALSVTPRAIFGLHHARIEAGAPACCTLFSKDGETILAPQAVQSLSKNNPFIAQPLPGRVMGMINY